MGDDLCDLPARELARRVRRREVSAAELLEAHLARIERENPALRAVVSLDAEAARAQARAADAASARGAGPPGPLHGVPMTLKDAFDVAGLRTTAGTPDLDHVSDADSTVAARLRAAGAILVGHTNVPPWLADHQAANPIFGRTANPWDPERTPGGSSGGAAAALAAGLTPLELGSDLVGSARLPASFCGVCGLKTTEHRVPATGFLRPPRGGPRPVRIMGCLGPMARDLGDLELALQVIAGPDGRDGDVPPVPLQATAPPAVGELRLAVAPTVPGATVSAAMRGEVERVAAAASDAGARVEERLPDVDWDALYPLFGELLMAITGALDPGSEPRSLAWYLTALERRDVLIAAWEAYFAGLDGLIFPAAMTTAFPHCPPGSEIDVDGTPVPYREIGMVYAFSNLTGLPALAVPSGHDAGGLPAGIQIAGARWSEMRLLAVAGALQAAGVLPGWLAPAPRGLSTTGERRQGRQEEGHPEGSAPQGGQARGQVDA
jgi:amidase